MATLILMSARPCTAVGDMVKYSELFPVRNTWNMLFTPCHSRDGRGVDKQRNMGCLEGARVSCWYILCPVPVINVTDKINYRLIEHDCILHFCQSVDDIMIIVILAFKCLFVILLIVKGIPKWLQSSIYMCHTFLWCVIETRCSW